MPNAKRDVQLVTIQSTRSIYEYLPASIDIKLKNKGNIHVAPVGSLYILKKDKQVGLVDFNKAGGNVLPGTNRVFNLEWNDGFPRQDNKKENGVAVRDKDGKEIKELKWEFSQIPKFRIGKYTAKLLAVYSDVNGREIPVEGSVSFWVIPWKILLGGAFILFLIGVGLYVSTRRFFKTLKPRKRTR